MSFPVSRPDLSLSVLAKFADCACGLGGAVDWPLVMDAAYASTDVQRLLADDGPVRSCGVCGRPVHVDAPVFVVSVLNEPLRWQGRHGVPQQDRWSEMATTHLMRNGMRGLARAVGECGLLTTVQMEAAILHEPERSIPAARATVGAWNPYVSHLLDVAEREHEQLKPAQILREFGQAPTYSLARLIAESHPWLDSNAGRRRIKGVARRIRNDGHPHAAADLLRPRPPREKTFRNVRPSAVLGAHLEVDGYQLTEASAEALDVRFATRHGEAHLDDSTWAGLLVGPARCTKHSAACDCGAYLLELLARSHPNVVDADVAVALAELAVVLVDVEIGDRPGLLDAAAYINRALMERHTDDPSLLARTQLNFSILCNQWSTGDVEAMLREGETAALAAMEFYRRDEFPDDWAKAAGTLANNYSSRLAGSRSDNLRQAVELYEGALEVRTRVDDPVGFVELRSNLAMAHLVGGSTASVRRALPLLEDAREFHRNAGMQQQWLNDTCSLARALALTSGRQEIERAVGLLREALATVDRDAVPRTWIGLASQLAATLGGLDDTLQQSKHREEAASLLELALELAVVAQWDRTIRLCGGQLGFIRLALGDVEGAAAAFKEATAASDRIWAAQSDASTRIAERMGDEDLFLHAASALAIEGRPLEAIHAIERLRARELLARRSPAATGVPVPSGEAVRDVVRPSVAALYVWAIHDRSFAVLVVDGKDQSFDCALSSTDAIRVPAVGAHWGRALVRGRTSAADEPAVVEGRGRIAVQGEPGTMPDFEQLRPALDELTSPWISLIADRDIQMLNVVACGPLANLPWALLPGVDGEPLVMSVDLASPPSLSWAASSPLPGPDKTGTVVVADTDPARPLPYASLEADHITRHTGGTRLHGQEATLAGVLRSVASARVLHLACHGSPEVASRSAPGPAVTEADIAALPADDLELGGLLEARYHRPEAVSVALAGGDRLQPEDVTASRHVAGTAVVVLAGCDTALLARQRLSDDPFGLPSAFLAAGAQGVIAALWPVDDAATALAMADLHEHLAAGHHPAQALSRAQRWLANATAVELRSYVQARPDLARGAWLQLTEVGEDERPYHHPKFWAAFVYIG